jgi:hypothetical protein
MGPRQKGLPGIADTVRKYPKLDDELEAHVELLDELDKARGAVEEHADTLQKMLREKKLRSYASERLMIGIKTNEPRLYAKRLTAPKKKDEAA